MVASELRLPITKGQLWTGRIMSGLGVAFLLMDGVMKLFKPAPVREAFARLGYPEGKIVAIGVLLLICTALYLIPRASIFGAILLTGFLGGQSRLMCGSAIRCYRTCSFQRTSRRCCGWDFICARPGCGRSFR